MTLKLRPWQDSAINKAINWLAVKKKDKRFLINAAPGAGKTICAAVLAKNLIVRLVDDDPIMYKG